MFKFNFSELDIEDDESQPLGTGTNPDTEQPEPASRTSTEPTPSIPFNVSNEHSIVDEGAKFHELSLDELVCALPPAFSYSPLVVPLSGDANLELNRSSDKDQAKEKRHETRRKGNVTLLRRDLFDARYQLISEDTDDSPTASDPVSQPASEQATSTPALKSEKNKRDAEALSFIDNPSDLVPGEYEGGLKTWECSLDLVDCLSSLSEINGNKGNAEWARGKRIIEIGCGTAIPSIYLLHELFSHPLPADSNLGLETEIILQDYNDLVLRLVTFPNVLLAWYASPLAEPYRTQRPTTESSAEAKEEPCVLDPSQSGDMHITSALLPAFHASLKEQRISLRFIAGSWQALSRNASLFATPFDLTLTSETIYQTSSLPALIRLLKCASLGAPGGNLKCADGSERDIHTMTRVLSLQDHGRLCLVAAKVLYFGVGGGVMDFERAVVEWSGKAITVLQKSAGVGRKVMKVEWMQK